MPLTSLSDLTFSYLSGNNLATLLGANLAIDGLTVLEINNGMSISSNTLTVGAGGIDTLSANHTINLNSAINLGAAQTWQIGSAYPVNVNGNLGGASSMTKANAGTLNLNASNSFSGTLYVDSNASGILSDGMVVLANSNAILNAASPVQIRNGNSCSSTLAFSGGNISLAQNIQMVCRNNTVPSLENLSGTNTLVGNLFISQGGSNVVIQCDSGLLNIAGNIAYNGSLVGNRAWNFVSTGVNLVSGAISNASNGSVISLSQSGAGTLILSNANYFTGNTRIYSGTLRLGHTNALQAGTLNLDAGDTGTLNFGLLTNANLGGLAGSRNLSLLNNSSAPVALNIGGGGAYAGILSGAGSLIKSGAGIFSLANASTYTGATTVSGGTLKLARDPIVKFTFDSVSGSANGSIVTNSGTGGSALNGVIVTNNGTGASGASFVAGKVGNALSLAGDGTFVAISNRVTSFDGSTAGVNWTLAMWIKTSQAGAGYAYQGDGGWVSGNTAFYLNQGNTSAGTRVGAVRYAGGWLTGSAGVNDGNWHFIAITDSSGIKNVFVDGNLDAATTAWGNPGVGGQFWIGGTADGGDGVADMNGLIDEVSIYNRALSQTEARSLTNALPALTPGSFGGQLPFITALSVSSGAAFDLGGNSQTVASLADGFGGGVITNSGAAPVTLTLGGGSGTNTFSGVIADTAATNAISLVKNGAAVEILAGANHFRGATTVNNGALIVHGSLGTNSVTVNGGALGGNGVIGGPMAIQSGGTLSSGNSTGLLTINNTLTLGGTTFIEINKAAPTNDVIQGISTIAYGGMLTVTNLGGTLAAGDSFKIFYATNYTGSFAMSNLPPLGVGLAWNMNALTNGTLSIVATLPPQFGAITQTADGNFQFTGSGSAGVAYELDAATNLAPPIAWNFVTNAMADQNGRFQFSDLLATNFPQRFYRIISGQ
jgi:autotransporter-associated beta strand protein